MVIFHISVNVYQRVTLLIAVKNGSSKPSFIQGKALEPAPCPSCQLAYVQCLVVLHGDEEKMPTNDEGDKDVDKYA